MVKETVIHCHTEIVRFLKHLTVFLRNFRKLSTPPDFPITQSCGNKEYSRIWCEIVINSALKQQSHNYFKNDNANCVRSQESNTEC